MKPVLSVLMSVYNGEEYLNEAIESILNQSFSDFEFLIINDASTDNSHDIILAYEDPRIRLVNNITNIGLTRSLNKGIELSKGDFIARMDADDISLCNRLATQIEFLNRNPEVALVGSFGIFFNNDTLRDQLVSVQAQSDLIFTELFFKNNFIHSSVMFKKSLVATIGYNVNLPFAQDYYLWTQVAYKYPVANIELPLIKYRIHSKSISLNKKDQQDNCVKETQKLHLKLMGLNNLNDSQLRIHFNLFFGVVPKSQLTPIEIEAYLNWILFLLANVKNSNNYNRGYFQKRLGDYWQIYFHLINKCKFKLNSVDLIFNSFTRQISIFRKVKILLMLLFNRIK
ncbi:glycosyltransferase family 2 protein [Peijinzhouia sedimentorum]